jgi:AcrR family transcriptional regulator
VRGTAGNRLDRRVVRTRHALGTALVELMLDRRFEEITVRELLARARVGRSTFYAHFRNTPDLLLASAERYLGLLEDRFLEDGAAGQRVAPVAELFAHLADVEQWHRQLRESGMHDAVFALVRGHLARLIARRVAVLAPTVGSQALPRGAIARLFAAALVEMLQWWIDHGAEPAPAEMDARYHEIVWGAIERMSSSRVSRERITAGIRRRA